MSCQFRSKVSARGFFKGDEKVCGKISRSDSAPPFHTSPPTTITNMSGMPIPMLSCSSPVQRLQRRVAILIRGEACSPPARLQLNASISQLDMVVAPLVSKGFGVDVFSSTYTNPCLESALQVFREYLRVDLRTKRPGSQYINVWEGVASVISYAHENNIQYSFLAVIRHDMVMKINWVDNLLGCMSFCPAFRTKVQMKGDKRVTDTLMVVAGSRIGCFFEGLNIKDNWPLEAIWARFEPVFGEGNMTPLVDYESDSNPEIMPNTLFTFYDRIECNRTSCR